MRPCAGKVGRPIGQSPSKTQDEDGGEIEVKTIGNEEKEEEENHQSP